MRCRCRCGCPIWVSKKSGRLLCSGCDPDTTVFGRPAKEKHANDPVEDKKPWIQAWKEQKVEEEMAGEEKPLRRWNTDPERGWMNERQREKVADAKNADELRGRAR
jgi:uncharacterized Zn finger protein (UPF0148 family)